MKKQISLCLFTLFIFFFISSCTEQEYQEQYQQTENNREEKIIENQILCTADVFECPDGSFVSRDSNNNCEFKECIYE